MSFLKKGPLMFVCATKLFLEAFRGSEYEQKWYLNL